MRSKTCENSTRPENSTKTRHGISGLILLLVLLGGTAAWGGGEPMGVDADIDTDFGVDGYVVLSAPNPSDEVAAVDVAVQADGRIVVLAWALSNPPGTEDVLVYRFLDSGVPDPSFGSGGQVAVQFPFVGKKPAALALQADGKIVVAATVASTSLDFALARLTNEGLPDTTFDGDGYWSLDLEPGAAETEDEVTAVAIQSDQKIVILGNSPQSSGNKTFFTVARLTSNGALDGTFGFGGIGQGDFNLGEPVSFSTANALALDSMDRAVIVGKWHGGAGFDQWAFARLTPTGFFDTTFAGDGTTIGSWVPFDDADFNDVVIRPDGSYLATGTATLSGLTRFIATLALMQPTGVLDPLFGSQGVAFLEFVQNVYSSEARHLAFDRSGMTIITGNLLNGLTESFLGLIRTAGAAYHPAFPTGGLNLFFGAPGDSSFRSSGGLTLDRVDRIVVGASAEVFQDPPVSDLRTRPFLTRLRSTLLFADGFESGDISRWNGNTGSMAHHAWRQRSLLKQRGRG